MKVISYNVNGLRAVLRKETFQQMLEQYDPDLVLLQEVKCSSDQYYGEISDYDVFINDSEVVGRHGTAILVRSGEPIEVYNLKDPVDGYEEGRLMSCVYKGLNFLNTYSVNSRHDLSRLEQRAIHDRVLLHYAKTLRNAGLFLCGDYNVLDEPIDIWRGYLIDGASCQTASERDAFKEILKVGYTDVFRKFYPDDADAFTYFSYQNNAKSSNQGWRVDYILASPTYISRVKSIEILTDVTGSDHVPYLFEIQD